MIDFSKITKTLDGYACHYFGTRESYGTKLHCFGVWTGYGCCESAYDEQGRHLVWCHKKTCWNVSASQAFQIIAPPKIVEVTRWVALKHSDGLFEDHGDVDDFYVLAYMNEPKDDGTLLAYKQHTFRFEVPNE